MPDPTPNPSGLPARQNRSESTRHALMNAAEKLIAQRGIENVSIRDIIASAKQKNESALQYHFKNLSGLVEAIHTKRSEQSRQARATLLEELSLNDDPPSLRELCKIMVQPSFDLARAEPGYRRYIMAFGHLLMLSESDALTAVSQLGGGGASGQQMGVLLQQAMPQLSLNGYQRRMDSAVRLCSASMYHHARQPHAFKGEAADLFFQSLVDSLVGLLSAPESSETKALAQRVEQGSPST